jgi:hypothetical protein
MSQDKQDKSKDVKDDVQQPGASVPAKKVKLGDEIKSIQMANIKKLYDTKFIPWVQKAFADSLPGAEVSFPQNEFGTVFNPFDQKFMACWRQLALDEDGLLIGEPTSSGDRMDDQYYFKIQIAPPPPKSPRRWESDF